jgi:hypothetical protein
MADKTFTDTPWPVIRKAAKADPKADWPTSQAQLKDRAHEVWQARPDSVLSGWTWYVLKSYQADRTKDFARAFCLVKGFETELGDVYWSDILSSARRIR